MAAKKNTQPTTCQVRTEKDAYEEGVFAALKILKDYANAKCDALRDVDAGIATGLLGPVVNILGQLTSDVGYQLVEHLHARREAERSEQATKAVAP